MSTATKEFLAFAWAAAGAGVAILGDAIGMPSLILPGLMLVFLGLGIALHVEQSRHFAAPGEENGSGRQGRIS